MKIDHDQGERKFEPVCAVCGGAYKDKPWATCMSCYKPQEPEVMSVDEMIGFLERGAVPPLHL